MFRLECSKKVSSNLVLDNLELHKVCNSLGWYNLILQEACSIEESSKVWDSKVLGKIQACNKMVSDNWLANNK